MKQCSRCGEVKSLDEFYRNRGAKDGLAHRCKVCDLFMKEERRQALKTRSDEEIEAAAAARGSKRCIRCNLVKSTAEFSLDRGRADGRGSKCHVCNRADAADDRRRRPEAYKISRAPGYGNNRAVARKVKLKYHFGMTPEQYDAMWAAQDGKCAICRHPETQVRRGLLRQLAVDHDHETNAVRQLLCARCNTGIGWFRENPEHMRIAAEYVERHNLAQGKAATAAS